MKSYFKEKRCEDKKYLAYLKKQECCRPNCCTHLATGFISDIIPAHQRILGHGGIGIKPGDNEALPLCFLCHSVEHRGAVKFWGQINKAKTKDFVYVLCYFKYNEYLLKG